MRRPIVAGWLATTFTMIANIALAELPYRTPIQTIVPEMEEVSTEGGGRPGLGRLVAVRDGVALISMTSVIPNEVAVFRYINGAWERDGKLPCPGNMCNQVHRFVYRDNTAIVSAEDDDNHILVFKQRQGKWHLASTISNPDPADYFGSSLAYQDGILAVSAYTNSEGVGSLHVYNLSSSGKVQSRVTLRPQRSGQGNYFGQNVAMARDTIVASARGNGLVYVFRRIGGQWVEAQELYGMSQWPEGFGSAVALNKGVLIVGAIESERIGRAEVTGYQAGGMAYMFREQNGQFVFQQRFRPSFEESYSYTDFSRHIAMFGDRVVIGAIDAPVIGAGEGLAVEYRITPNGLQPVSQMRTPGAGGFALYHNTLIMGSHYDEALMSVGSASVFNIYLPVRAQ